MTRAIAAIALFAALISPCMAENKPLALTVEECRTDQRSWSNWLKADQEIAAKTTRSDITFAQLTYWGTEMRVCKKVDPVFAAQYEITENEIAFELEARYYNFIYRHNLWDQFLAEDAKGQN